MTSSIPSHPLPSGHHLAIPIPDHHRPSTISPGLYLSSRKPTQDPSMLSQIGITAVLSILTAREARELHLHPNQAPDPSQSSPDSPPRLRRQWIEMRDSRRANLLVRLGDACDFIDAEIAAATTTTTAAAVVGGEDEERRRDGGKVLVHCWAARSRSAAVAAAYLMRWMRWTAAQALGHVAAARPDVRPNPGFVRQLEVWKACGYDIWEAYGYTSGGRTSTTSGRRRRRAMG
ncbi:protein-tyrosine phosphatase-like protein [Phialemonium atrogriseum]|uniref:protein-tyrosine-phosphatase n=1 Tax=Phialemonium atrogriseum TaxID=1093897 RepID=A0AAJ0FHE1_9PEZI|nr:protein-tyrosine phosphatase-like protein [Phialemonium atrogriseum]KAK1762074.1 protein-tyrosine phosphatase-like protein [Phialemonium atrogriseum]